MISKCALDAINHKVPEFVPAYVRNIQEWERHAALLGFKTWEGLADHFGNTILSFVPDHKSLPNPKHTTGLPAVWGVPEEYHTTYTDSIPRPLASAETVADVEAFSWPSVDDWDFTTMHNRLKEEKDHLRLGPSWMPVFSRLCELFGMERAMINLYTNRRVIEAALAHLDNFYTEFYRTMLDVCADSLDVFGLGDDFAGNDSLLIDPSLWRRLFLPLYAKWFGMAKKKALPTLMHCCGKIIEVLPDLIDAGLDAWQTVQTHLPGQEPETIKSLFGRHLTFVGAIDTTNVLGTASPEAVKEHVRSRILALGENGGYICAPDHTVMAEVPTKNLIAL